jgi:hypothetical protein
LIITLTFKKWFTSLEIWVEFGFVSQHLTQKFLTHIFIYCVQFRFFLCVEMLAVIESSCISIVYVQLIIVTDVGSIWGWFSSTWTAGESLYDLKSDSVTLKPDYINNCFWHLTCKFYVPLLVIISIEYIQNYYEYHPLYSCILDFKFYYRYRNVLFV